MANFTVPLHLDQLVEYLHQNSDIQILDLRPILLLAKDKSRLYHKTDTHWNQMGGFLTKQLYTSFPILQAKNINEFKIEKTLGKGVTLLTQLEY